jgi:hypothetical protein
MDGIEPPEGLEWLNNGDGDEEADGFVKRIRRKPIQHKQRGGHHSIEEDDIRVDFGPLRGEGLRRFENSYSLFEVEEEDVEVGDELEEGEPIPWFGEWQKMIVKEKRKTEEEEKRRMRELKPAKVGGQFKFKKKIRNCLVMIFQEFIIEYIKMLKMSKLFFCPH